MKYRNMGKHGLLLSEISLGTMYVGSHHSKDQSLKVLKTAIEQGINFIDSADRYGIYDSELPMEQRTPAEIIVGEFIQDYDEVPVQETDNPNSLIIAYQTNCRQNIHEN